MASSKRSVEKEGFWRLALAVYANSGLPVRAFCQREALSEASFYFWRREFRTRDQMPEVKSSSPQLIPVQLVDSKTTRAGSSPTPPENAVIQVGIPGGFSLRAGPLCQHE
jgi:hypothetical protein